MPQASCCLSGSWAGWGHLPALTTYFFWPDLLTASVIGVTFHWVCGFSNVCIKAQIKLPGEDKDPTEWCSSFECYSQINCFLVSFCLGIQLLLWLQMAGHTRQWCACQDPRSSGLSATPCRSWCTFCHYVVLLDITGFPWRLESCRWTWYHNSAQKYYVLGKIDSCQGRQNIQYVGDICNFFSCSLNKGQSDAWGVRCM